MSDGDQVLLSSDAGHVRTLTLNRPDRANALNAELIANLTVALVAADQDPDVRRSPRTTPRRCREYLETETIALPGAN